MPKVYNPFTKEVDCPLSVMVCVRVTAAMRQGIYREARRYGRPAATIRKLLEAFADGRVRIIPDPDKPSLERQDD